MFAKVIHNQIAQRGVFRKQIWVTQEVVRKTQSVLSENVDRWLRGAKLCDCRGSGHHPLLCALWKSLTHRQRVAKPSSHPALEAMWPVTYPLYLMVPQSCFFSLVILLIIDTPMILSPNICMHTLNYTCPRLSLLTSSTLLCISFHIHSWPGED